MGNVELWRAAAGEGPMWVRIRRLMPFIDAVLALYLRRYSTQQRNVLRARMLVAMDRQMAASMGESSGPWYPRGELDPPEAGIVIDLREKRTWTGAGSAGLPRSRSVARQGRSGRRVERAWRQYEPVPISPGELYGSYPHTH